MKCKILSKKTIMKFHLPRNCKEWSAVLVFLFMFGVIIHWTFPGDVMLMIDGPHFKLLPGNRLEMITVVNKLKPISGIAQVYLKDSTEYIVDSWRGNLPIGISTTTRIIVLRDVVSDWYIPEFSVDYPDVSPIVQHKSYNFVSNDSIYIENTETGQIYLKGEGWKQYYKIAN